MSKHLKSERKKMQLLNFAHSHKGETFSVDELKIIFPYLTSYQLGRLLKGIAIRTVKSYQPVKPRRLKYWLKKRYYTFEW